MTSNDIKVIANLRPLPRKIVNKQLEISLLCVKKV